MAIRRTLREKGFEGANIFFMLLLMVFTLYPFLYVLFASISNPSLLMAHQGILIRPMGFNLGAYKMVFKNPMILIGYKNTLFYVVVGVALNLLMTSFGAYLLSRRNFYWKKILMVMIIFTMFFSGGLIPFFLQVKGLGLYDSRWALIFPTAINTFNLIIMRTYFSGIPESMEESASVDGANDFIILFRIILPLSLPIVAVLVLFYGVSHWNAWFNAMIFLRHRELYPLQLVLKEILISNNTDSMITTIGSTDKEPIGETVKYATIIVATLPILAMYPFLQKYFVKGMMIGALKG